MIGKTIGAYTVLEKLGGGGMGVVYAARDQKLERTVALKFLPQSVDEDPVLRERFLREARSASALDHSNICTIHEIGETEDGQLFIAMAYYAGDSLKTRLSCGPLAADLAIDFARQIARGLSRAHRRGIVHRDIKPANLMVTDDGVVKIVDFGLAASSGETRLTRTGAALGTVPYMSPEQIRSGEVDHRTDLWSLGVVLYEMLSGRRPFTAASDLALFQSILEDQPGSLGELCPGLEPNLVSVIDRLLAKDPEQRFATADEVLAALGDSSDMTTSAETVFKPLPRSTGRTPRWSRRFALSGVACLVVLAAVLLWFFSWPRDHGRPLYSSLAVLPFSNLTGESTLDHISDGISVGLIARLSEIAGLQVVSRSEVWRFRGSTVPVEQLGERLGVGTILEGSLTRQAEDLTVTASLVEVRDGRVLWTESLSGASEEVLQLQLKIADRLIRVLSIGLSPTERRRLAQDPTSSFRAYEAYLQGVSLLESSDDVTGFEPAIVRFRQSIQLDPEFALAHAGLSEALWESANLDADPGLIEESAAAAREALRLDPALPAAQVALARALRGAGRYEESVTELRRALAGHPHPDDAYRELAHSIQRTGDLEGTEQALRTATGLDSENWRNHNSLGTFLWRSGDYDAARESFARAAELAPPHVSKAQENLASIEISRGRFDDAVAAYEQLETPIRRASLASNIGTAYFFSSHPEKWTRAEKYFELAVRLNPHNDEARRNLADLYLRLERDGEAEAEYRNALEIVNSRLAGEPENHDLRLRKAFYAAKSGDCGEAVTQARSMDTELPETAQHVHRLAGIFALCGETDAAFSAIERAVELGVPAELVTREDEFASLRADPRFAALSGHPR